MPFVFTRATAVRAGWGGEPVRRAAARFARDLQMTLTARLIRQVMGAVRAAGDGPHYYGWQRRVLYAQRDRGVMLITHWENHLSDADLYAALRRQREQT